MLKCLGEMRALSLLNILVFASILATTLSSCRVSNSDGKLEEYKETRPYFGTYFTVRCLYDKNLTDIQATMAECWQMLDDVQLNMNAASPMGYLTRINRSQPDAGSDVNDDLYRIIQDSVEFSRKAEGAFDITVRPLVELWKQAVKENVVPKKEDLEIALEKIGSDFIRLGPGNRVALMKPGMKLDLNAIAPAFAVDRAAEILTRNRIEHFMVDGSGEIYCKGNQPGERGWRVGVQDPTKKPDENVIDILSLKNYGVSTSGNYERFYTINGKRYSHIIDPRTGQPANGVISATVIAPTAEEANAFSTALCVLGSEKGIALIESIRGVEALVMEDRNGKAVISQTQNYPVFRVSR